jgi:hypothetical protein
MNLRTIGPVSVIVFAILGGSALAGPRDEVLDQLGKCATVADDKQRLACYDALSPRVKDALATPPTTLAHEPTKDEQKSWFGFDVDKLFGVGNTAVQSTPQQFGAEATPRGKADVAAVEEKELDSITAGVTDYSFTPFGKFVVFLDNGQIWRQQEGDTDLAHFSGKPSDNKVTLTRGAFGSYNLQLNDAHHQFKVTRVN